MPTITPILKSSNETSRAEADLRKTVRLAVDSEREAIDKTREASAARSSARSQEAALEQQLQTVEKLGSDISELEQYIQQLSDIKGSLEADENFDHTRLHQHQGVHGDLQAEVDQKRTQVQELGSLRKNLPSRIIQLQDDIIKYKLMIQQRVNQINVISTALPSIDEKFSKRLAELKKVYGDLKITQQIVDQDRAAVEADREELKGITEKIKQVKSEIKNLQRAAETEYKKAERQAATTMQYQSVADAAISAAANAQNRQRAAADLTSMAATAQEQAANHTRNAAEATCQGDTTRARNEAELAKKAHDKAHSYKQQAQAIHRATNDIPTDKPKRRALWAALKGVAGLAVGITTFGVAALLIPRIGSFLVGVGQALISPFVAASTLPAITFLVGLTATFAGTLALVGLSVLAVKGIVKMVEHFKAKNSATAPGTEGLNPDKAVVVGVDRSSNLASPHIVAQQKDDNDAHNEDSAQLLPSERTVEVERRVRRTPSL